MKEIPHLSRILGHFDFYSTNAIATGGGIDKAYANIPKPTRSSGKLASLLTNDPSNLTDQMEQVKTTFNDRTREIQKSLRLAKEFATFLDQLGDTVNNGSTPTVILDERLFQEALTLNRAKTAGISGGKADGVAMVIKSAAAGAHQSIIKAVQDLNKFKDASKLAHASQAKALVLKHANSGLPMTSSEEKTLNKLLIKHSKAHTLYKKEFHDKYFVTKRG